MSEMTWRKIEDELPDINVEVLGACKENGEWYVIEVCYTGSDKPYTFDNPHDAGMYPEISHWMPMPKPPED